MPCSVHAMLHRTGLYVWQTRALPTDYKSIPDHWFVSVAQADFRPRLLPPHPPERCDYRSVSPCLATSVNLPTLHIIETPKFLVFMLPLNLESWTHAGEFWICEALLFILVRLCLPHDQHSKWFTWTPPASSEITKLLQQAIDKLVPSALGWQWSPLI